MLRHGLGLLAFVVTACATAPVRTESPGLVFIEDDYAQALKLAKDRNVPLFVDAWAPWCHSCVFLKEHVFTRSELARHQKRFVFLSVDTEKEKNTPFLEKYSIDVWPTLFVIDSQREVAAFKWLGTGTVEQMERLFDDGERAVAAKGTADSPAALLAQADQLFAQGVDATDAYRRAVTAFPLDSPSRSRAVESWLNSLYGSQKLQPCMQVGLEYIPSLPKGPSLVNALVLGLGCALNAEPSDELRIKTIRVLEPIAVDALKLDGILADDKSGLFELVLELKTDKEAFAKQWLSFLEGEAAQATTPAARAVFDPHRVSAAIAAKEPLRVEAALLQSEKELPSDYNPPARLAVIYREAGRLDDARNAVERALAKAYGPRKLRIFETKASILAKQGDAAGQKKTLADAVEYGKALPKALGAERSVARIEKTLQKL